MQLVAPTRVAHSRRAPAVRTLPRCCRAVLPFGHALRETESSGAASQARPSSRRTPCPPADTRSEEHTSELQSRLHLVCRLLLEKKKETSTKRTLAHSLKV